DNLFQGAATHAAGAEPRRFANRAFRHGLFSRTLEWRRYNRQGFQALCRYRGVVVHTFNHHAPKAPTAKLKAKEECAYGHIASERRGLDAVLSPVGQVTPKTPHRPVCRKNRIMRTVNIVGIGFAGISIVIAVTAHGQLNTATSNNEPETEMVVDANGNL